MEKSEAMETVLITGASRGIGLELTRQFLHLGYNVISTYRNSASSELAALSSEGSLTLFNLEVTVSDSIAEFAHNISNVSIDILINNAGVIGPIEQALETIESADWLRTLAVNTIAPLLVSRSLIGNLKKSSNPRIITVSSQMGALNRESTGMYAYRSSKAALNKVMQVLAIELKEQGIVVCPVHPGWVKTDMGGPDAEISVSESAAGIVDLVRNLTMKQSGKFLTWQGEEHPW
ncbi:MAG: SDR family oxidoreductase [Parvibaculum sp.]|nr:SDR family oxidoreductase [Parvibaculum sp.]